MTKERLEEIDNRLNSIEIEKQKVPFYSQTKLLAEEAALREKLRAEYKRLKKAKDDVQIKESKPGLSATEARACAKEFIALQEEQIDIYNKYPDLCREDTHRPIYGRDTETPKPPPEG